MSDLKLINVLKEEIGTTNPRVSPSQGSQIGRLISREFLNKLGTSSESPELQQFLEEVWFRSKSNTFLPCQQLLRISSNPSEENLLVGFAPDSRILHPDYKDSGLEFFYVCRSRRDSISIEELVGWVLKAEALEKRRGVYDYLKSGERRDELAVNLLTVIENSWMASDKGVAEILELMRLLANHRGEDNIPLLELVEKGILVDDGKGNNSVKWGEFGECCAKNFYKWLGYTNIVKQDDRIGFDFLCISADLPEIKSEVKAIQFDRPNIRISKNEWLKMIQFGETYELLIVTHPYGQESVLEIIQIKNLWSTLQNHFFGTLHRRTKTIFKGVESELLLGFNLNDDSGEQAILINWSRLSEDNLGENLKRYHPSPSTNSSEDENLPILFKSTI